MSFGTNLKRERELRGISLEEISEATKIGVRLLEAIESDRHELLPGGIFRKSFIKSYARYLGMNEERVLQEYSLVAETAAVPAPAEEEFDLGKTVATFLHRNRRSAIGITIIIVLVGLSLWFSNKSGNNQAAGNPDISEKLTPGIVPEQNPASSRPGRLAASAHLRGTPPVAPKPSPIQKAAAPPTPAAGELKVLGERAKKRETSPVMPQHVVPESSKSEEPPNPGQLMLGIDATQDCWLSVSSRDSALYSGKLEPKESKKFSLQRPLKLTVGNAGGVRLSINGKPFAALGKSGEVRMIEITPQNYPAYLATGQH